MRDGDEFTATVAKVDGEWVCLRADVGTGELPPAGATVRVVLDFPFENPPSWWLPS